MTVPCWNLFLAIILALVLSPALLAQGQQMELPKIAAFECEDLAALSLWLDDIQSKKAPVDEALSPYLDIQGWSERWWDPVAIDGLFKKGIFQKCDKYKGNPLFKEQVELEAQLLKFIVRYPCRPNIVEAMRLFVIELKKETKDSLSQWRREALDKALQSSISPFPPEESMMGYCILLSTFWLERNSPNSHSQWINEKLEELDGPNRQTAAKRDKALYQAIIAYNRMVSNNQIRSQSDFALCKESQVNLLAGTEDAVMSDDYPNYNETIYYFLENSVGGMDAYVKAHFPKSDRSVIEKLKSPEQCIDFLASLDEPTKEDWQSFSATELLIGARANLLLPTQSGSFVIPGEGFEFFGGILLSLDDTTRRFFKLPADLTGFFLESADEDSLCMEWGLNPGDIIVEINGSAMVNVEKAAISIERELNSGTKQIDFKVFRDGRTISLSAKLERDSNINRAVREVWTMGQWPLGLVVLLLIGALAIFRTRTTNSFVSREGPLTPQESSIENATQPSMSLLTNLATLENYFAPRYKSFRLLGKGGMGLVYRVRDGHLQRDVALKVISPLLVEDKEVKRRFLREVRALAALEHRGIVRVFDFGQEEFPFYTMELVEGPSLRSLIEKDEFTGSFEKVIELARELAEIVSHAHEQGVIHRDIKPSNIITRAEGGLKLIDFGVAAMEGSTTITHSLAVVGTPAFFAPEVIAGSSASAQSDQYSYGKVLYLLVGGSQAIEAAGTAFHGPPKPLAEVSPDCPEKLIKVIERCMATKANERFPAMSNVYAALSDIV